MSTVLASGADRRYGYWLLNLLGSVQSNSDVFDRIVVYDLGMTPHQARLVGAVRGVEVRRVEPFVPHWAKCYSWKPWIWTHTEADILFWLDAGSTVLRSLEPALAQIRERGYFLVSQNQPLSFIVPADYYALYDLPDVSERSYVAAGIIGFASGSAFHRDVIVPTYEDVVRGRNLGFSPGDLESANWGLTYLEEPTIRDCREFRHDQTLLNIHLLRVLPDAIVADGDQYAGSQSQNDHPEQVVWGHRRDGDFRYLPRVRYDARTRVPGLLFGVRYRSRWWLRLHRWVLRPSTYAHKVRRVLRAQTPT